MPTFSETQLTICFKPHFICNLFQYIQQTVYKRIMWHVEECSVALLCNYWHLEVCSAALLCNYWHLEVCSVALLCSY
jgi:hypothetical protein